MAVYLMLGIIIVGLAVYIGVSVHSIKKSRTEIEQYFKWKKIFNLGWGRIYKETDDKVSFIFNLFISS